MPKNLRNRTLFIVAILVASVLGITGFPKSGPDLRRNLQENVKLGLDLRGGSHLILQVQVQDAVRAEADQVVEQLKEALGKGLISYAAIERNDPQRVEEADTIAVTVKGLQPSRTADFRQIVSDRFPEWTLGSTGANDFRLTPGRLALQRLKQSTVERSRTTIEQRINALGLTEPLVQLHGAAESDHEILVQLPGVDDPARVKNIMQTTAQLELAEVQSGPFGSPQEATAGSGGVLPPGTRLLKERARGGPDSWLVVSQGAVVRGTDLRDARPSQDQFGKWETQFFLKTDGARRFETFTGNNIGKRLAVILDRQVFTAPTIQGRIGDTGVITGVGTEQEANDLALVLRAGSLPASLVYLEERTVGASLGADSVRRGVTAGVVGLALVIAVMLVYYKASGLNAVLALLLNTLITVAGLAYFDAVWTLPGIAGLVLSIGMAVDSNVLIFERIKEEMRAGKAVPAAVAAGFDRAFLTIIDTHVTTVVSSAFLFLFGTGPIKGFAVTLVIGLIANLFTAVFVSRTIFDWSLSRNPRQSTLSI